MVYSMSGWIGIQSPRFDSSFTEGFSSTFALALVAFSALYPLLIGGILFYYLSHNYMPNELIQKYGSIVDGVYGVKEDHIIMAFITILLPLVRNFFCVVAVSTQNEKQTTSFFFMISTLI